MEEYYCSKCERNLYKYEIFSKPIEPPMVFDGKNVTLPWGVSLPDTAKYYCRKHMITVEIKNS